MEVSALSPFIESLPQICFEGKWLQNRLRTDKDESRSLLTVDIRGHKCGGFCIVPIDYASSSLSLKFALRESGCRIGYEPTKMSRDHFWRSISRDTNMEVSALSPFIESFPQICFEGKWLQNRLRTDKDESRSLLTVDIRGHKCGGFCIVPIDYASSSLSLKFALRESGCRIGYEPTKMSRDHFWRSISRDTNMEVSALSPFIESFPQICFEGKWLQNRLRTDKDESRSLLTVDIRGHKCGGFCIVPIDYASSSLSLKFALRESGCRIGYEPTKMSRDQFWRSISRDTNVEVSASPPFLPPCHLLIPPCLLAFLSPTTCHLSNLRSINLI